jgi:hypothetical protein
MSKTKKRSVDVSDGEELVEFAGMPYENTVMQPLPNSIDENFLLSKIEKLDPMQEFPDNTIFTPEEEERARNVDPEALTYPCSKCHARLEGFDLYQAHQHVEHDTNSPNKWAKQFKGKPDKLKKEVRKAQKAEGKEIKEEIYLTDLKKENKSVGVVVASGMYDLLKEMGLVLKFRFDDIWGERPELHASVLKKAMALKKNKKYKEVFLIKPSDRSGNMFKGSYVYEHFTGYEIWVRKNK